MTKIDRAAFCPSLLALIILITLGAACKFGGSSNSNNSNNSSNSNNNNNSGSSSPKTADTSPVNITIKELFLDTATHSISENREKYQKRSITVTDGVLYEMKADFAKVGVGQNPDFGPQSSAPQYFVTCIGAPAGYSAEAADRVEAQRLAGSAPTATVTGTFKEADSYGSKHWVLLDQCTMSQ
ncbi:MAG: hypothetical protein ABIP75_02160 [Pyrinomonadaceae bacterium]